MFRKTHIFLGEFCIADNVGADVPRVHPYSPYNPLKEALKRGRLDSLYQPVGRFSSEAVYQ